VTNRFGTFEQVRFLITSSCESSDTQLLYPFADRQKHIVRIVEKALLPLVVARCRMKIFAIFSEPYSKPFRTWYEDVKASKLSLDSVDDDKDLILALLDIIYLPSGGDEKKPRDDENVVAAIISACHVVVNTNAPSTLEPQWINYHASTLPLEKSLDEELLDDYEYLDPLDIRKSAVHRFLWKLGRYYTACYTVVRELIFLHRSWDALCIKVDTVPIIKTTSKPSEEREYHNLDTFLKQCTNTDLKTLDPKKADGLRDKWTPAWKNANLFLHAEMQLVLFYTLNPQLSPIRGYIGASKKCCWCCDFVLK